MSSTKRGVDPIPDEFASYEELGEFWDTHDTMDYPDAFAREGVEVQANLTRRRYEVEVEEDLRPELRERARQAGISVAQLVSDLLRRQLAVSS
jgi:predicted HicB family RNase H-like nuclease